jgi:UDP:flavonoid glycosyltransferase YjiC (YdhE family)
MAGGGELWLIYALGGGWGHLTRAAALARVACARKQVRILTNSPYAPQVRRALPELEIVALDPTLPTPTVREQAVQQVRAADPSCFIVDTFPRGLGGELADIIHSLRATKVLVHRDLSPRYVAEAKLRAFVRSVYDLIFIPGEDEGAAFADLPAAVVTEPWLIRDPPHERDHARQPSVVVCAAGTEEELSWYGAVVGALQALDGGVDIQCVAPVCPPGCPQKYWIEHWPASDLYADAGVVVGGAGYNTIYECVAFEVPLIARPWPRKYDRQWLRARRGARLGLVTIVKEPREAAKAAIRQHRHTPARRSYIPINGVHEAIIRIRNISRSERGNT